MSSYLFGLENDQNDRMKFMKRALAYQYYLSSVNPVYSSMTMSNANSTIMSAQDIVDAIKSGDIEIVPMNGKKVPDLSKWNITIFKEHIGENARIIDVFVDNGERNGNLVISNLDFSKEYQAYISIGEKDERFYAKIRGDQSECRKVHNAMMDLLERSYLKADDITLRALETLEIMPEYSNINELQDIVLGIQNRISLYCEQHKLEIDAMNTMSPSQIIDMRNFGRDFLRENGIDAILNQAIESSDQAINVQDLEEAMSHDRF